MKGVLKTRKVEHRSTIYRGDLPDFLKKLDAYSGDLITKLMLSRLRAANSPAGPAPMMTTSCVDMVPPEGIKKLSANPLQSAVARMKGESSVGSFFGLHAFSLYR